MPDKPHRGVSAGRAAFLLLCLLAVPAAAQEPRTITLEDAVRLALQRDPAAVSAEAALSNARADQLSSRGALLPNVSVTSWYANSSNERFDQASGRLVSESYTSQLQGTYDVFTAGRKLANLRSAGANVHAAEATYESQRFNTILNTTTLFYAAAAADGLVKAAMQRSARAKEQLAAANTRLELGTATQSDALRAQLEQGNAELALIEAQTSLRSAQLALGRQVGESSALAAAPEALPDHAPTLPATTALIAQAAQSAPAVVSADATFKARRADKLAAYTPFLPTLRLSGGYDWFAYQWPADQRTWSLRLTASLPVLNGFQRESALQRAAANERVAEARARDARIQIGASVETAVANIGAAERRVQIADRAVQLAREDLRVVQERYGMGVSTIVELQTSQLALSDAEVASVKARQTLGTAIASLESILGRTISEE